MERPSGSKSGTRRGAGAMGAGAAATGVLAYVFFALVVRTLGAGDAAPISVLWTWWSFSAAGLSFPIQHWVSRTVAEHRGAEGVVRAAMPALAGAVAAVSVLVGVLAWLARDPLFGSDGVIYPLLAVALSLGAAWLGLVRGMLIARSDLTGVGLCLTAENGLRVALVLVLIALGVDDPRWYAAVLPLGQLCALLWPAAMRLRGPGTPQPWWRFVASVAGGQVVGQTVLVGGPVLLALLGGTPAQVTSLFAALALFRAPYTFAFGALSPLTAAFTRLLVEGRHHAVRRHAIGIALGTVVVTGLAALLAAAIGPWLLRLVFGHTVRLPLDSVVLLAAGSALALGTLAASMVTMARNRPHALLRAWLLAMVAAALVLVIGPTGALDSVVAAFVVAQAVAWVAILPTSLGIGFGKNTRTS